MKNTNWNDPNFQGFGRQPRPKKERKAVGTPLGRTLLNIAVTLVFAAVYFYIVLPPISLKSEDFYVFVLLVCAVYGGCAILTSGFQGTGVKVCTVVGFPLGATTTESKVFETLQAVRSGAEEIDMVMNVCAMKSGNTRAIEQEIQALAAAVEGHAILKVILETCLLTEEEKILACQIAKRAGADYVKTSTGFSTGGATVADVALMRRTVGPEMGVKAAGGIRDYAAAKAMLDAGATRIGASAGIAIVQQEQEALGK